jgi:hypothetical protein
MVSLQSSFCGKNKKKEDRSFEKLRQKMIWTLRERGQPKGNGKLKVVFQKERGWGGRGGRTLISMQMPDP